MGRHDLSLTDPAAEEFWRERHLCAVTLVRPDGTPHVTPMGIALGTTPGTAWAITSRTSLKARLLGTDGPIAACQVDGRRWSTLHGNASLRTDPESIAEAVAAYAARYRTPRENPDRVAIHIAITRVVGSLGLAAG